MATAVKHGFGQRRKLSRGNFQARHTGPDMREHNAPTTFVPQAHAEKWLV